MEIGKICIIEDDQSTSEILLEFFTEKNYLVTTFGSAEEFYPKLDAEFRGLYLIDRNLPGDSGLEIIKRIRSVDKISMIFLVSAAFGKEQIMEGLEAGADDYLTKPFSINELDIRAQNAQKKLNHIDSELWVGLKLLPQFSAFIKDGVTVNLTNREYIIFEKLRNNYKQPIGREEIISSFSNDEKVTVRNIDVHVFSLRKKIKEAGFSIETVWGKGYQLHS